MAKKLTEEHKRKISIANKGQIPWMKGKHHSEESKRKLSEAHKKLGTRPPSPYGRILSLDARKRIGDAHRAEKSPSWKGDNVGYSALHYWARKYIPKPEVCIRCKTKKLLEISNNGIYNREPKNWEWLCKNCHRKKDGKRKARIR